MKPLPAIVLFGLFISSAVGQERPSAMVAPLPRVRLDPVHHKAVVEQPIEAKSESAAPAVVMDKFVVKARSAVPKGPPIADPPTKEKFSPLKGGYILKGEIGKAEWRLGIFPSLEVVKSHVSSEQIPRLSVGILSISW